MTYMHGLGDIRSAEIDHHRLAGAGLRAPRHIQRAGTRIQRCVGQINIEKAGTGNLHLGENRFSLQPGGNLLGNGARIGLGRLRRRQRAVALELRQVRPVGRLHATETLRQAFRREGLPRDA